jgi:hypothetical protein
MVIDTTKGLNIFQSQYRNRFHTPDSGVTSTIHREKVNGFGENTYSCECVPRQKNSCEFGGDFHCRAKKCTVEEKVDTMLDEVNTNIAILSKDLSIPNGYVRAERQAIDLADREFSTSGVLILKRAMRL